MNDQQTNRVEIRQITKAFPGVLANDQISFSVKPGEIHALLGENGAGKSTLVKMIYGIMQPDAGSIAWNGETTPITSPKAARALGIGMVFQHFSLFDALTVLENIALGMDAAIPQAELENKIRAVLDRYNLTLDPHRIVSTLSVGERQRIEIVRALLLNPSLLIMDEPTSVLTPQEVSSLFSTLRQLAQSGCAILYISHKLHEIKELCETATILRAGQVVATCDPRQETSESMAELMIGGDLKSISKTARERSGKEKFIVSNLDLEGEGDFGVDLKDIDFSVGEGEIFGIAGVAGNGQNELLLALSGEVTATNANCIKLNDAAIGRSSTTDRRMRGLCALPEERYGHGAVTDFSLVENTILTARSRMKLVSGGFVKPASAKSFAQKIISAFDVRTTGPGAAASSLSGGNLQKFIVGREMLQDPDVFIVSQPTWGVDAGAAAAIHQAIVDLAETGSAIIVISQDLDELLAICDTLAVINEGRLSEKMNVAEASVEEIGLLMGGITQSREAMSAEQA